MAADRIIKLTPEQYRGFKRALQWPEDLAAYDHAAKPTNLTEMLYLSQVENPNPESKERNRHD